MNLKSSEYDKVMAFKINNINYWSKPSASLQTEVLMYVSSIEITTKQTHQQHSRAKAWLNPNFKSAWILIGDDKASISIFEEAFKGYIVYSRNIDAHHNQSC